MDIEHIGLQLTRAEAVELYVALLQRAMVEDDIRQEEGLESMGMRPLMHRLEHLLQLAPEQGEALQQSLDHDLWKHAWYVFTDEWAWYRATQEIERELGSKKKTMGRSALHRLIEQRYTKSFDAFIGEIDMQGSSGAKKGVQKRKTI